VIASASFATFGASAARLLETGRLRSPPSETLSRAWANLARASRPVVLPRGVAVVGVGGATLGGSYKTPLVLALARALNERGERVAVVGHGYGSRWRSRHSVPGCVGPGDSALSVGDDALWLYRELSRLGVPVIVGGSRSAALFFAGTLAPRVIVDGLLQAEPERLALSVLALSADRPWGAGRCPPAGDLRASRAALLEATDVVTRVSSGALPGGPGHEGERQFSPFLSAGSRPVVDVGSELLGAMDSDGQSVPLTLVAGRRVGVVLAVARPDRVLASLASLGIVPVQIRLFRDHAAPRPRLLLPSGGASRPEVWLTTSKCATKLGAAYEGAPVLVLAHRLTLPQAFVDTVMASTAR
jgi:tetraacyldisaccharide 4'-kinase